MEQQNIICDEKLKKYFDVIRYHLIIGNGAKETIFSLVFVNYTGILA